jgi:hypothetical protein
MAGSSFAPEVPAGLSHSPSGKKLAGLSAHDLAKSVANPVQHSLYENLYHRHNDDGGCGGVLKKDESVCVGSYDQMTPIRLSLSATLPVLLFGDQAGQTVQHGQSRKRGRYPSNPLRKNALEPNAPN